MRAEEFTYDPDTVDLNEMFDRLINAEHNKESDANEPQEVVNTAIQATDVVS